MKSQSHVYEDINDEKKALSEMQADCKFWILAKNVYINI